MSLLFKLRHVFLLVQSVVSVALMISPYLFSMYQSILTVSGISLLPKAAMADILCQATTFFIHPDMTLCEWSD